MEPVGKMIPWKFNGRNSSFLWNISQIGKCNQMVKDKTISCTIVVFII